MTQLNSWEYGHICYRPDAFSYIVSWAQALPDIVVWGLTGISFYRRDLTFMFVIWIAYGIGFAVAYGLSHATGIPRPKNYFCSAALGYPDPFFVATMTTLLTFAYAALVTRLKIYLSTLVWFGIVAALYIFAAIWNFQMTVQQTMYSLGISFLNAMAVSIIYVVFIHPFKKVFMQTRIARWFGFENSL